MRVLAKGQLERIWRSLPGYDRPNLDQWLSLALPIVDAAKRQSSHVTDAYLARKLDRAPFGVGVPKGRNGVDPAEVYQRPFVTIWTALKNGTSYENAVNAGLARATSSVAMDVQLSMAQTAQEVGRADPQIQRFQRVADSGACEFCQTVDGAILNSEDAMDLHNNCGCGIEPLEDARPVTPTPDGVAVHDHGELGPLLTAPDQNFTTESQIAA